MNYKIRQATIKDLDAISNLWNKLAIDQMSRDEYFTGELDLENSKNQFLDSLTNDKCIIYIAYDNNTALGFIEVWLQSKDFYFFEDDYAYILHMYVEPSYKSYKLSVSLMNLAEEWAFSKGMKYLAADVFEFNSDVLKIFSFLGGKPYRTRAIKRLT